MAWNISSELTIGLDRQILYKESDNTIWISENGMYQVYSQVTFIHDNKTDKYGKAHTGVYVHEIWNTRTRLLFKSIKTACDSYNERQEVSSFISSVLELIKGDTLFVKVNHKDQLEPVPHMNFLGMHMLNR